MKNETLNVTEWLQSLNSDQIALVQQKVRELAAEKREKVKDPGRAGLDDLAAVQGLDLSSLMREISRK